MRIRCSPNSSAYFSFGTTHTREDTLSSRTPRPVQAEFWAEWHRSYPPLSSSALLLNWPTAIAVKQWYIIQIPGHLASPCITCRTRPRYNIPLLEVLSYNVRSKLFCSSYYSPWMNPRPKPGRRSGVVRLVYREGWYISKRGDETSRILIPKHSFAAWNSAGCESPKVHFGAACFWRECRCHFFEETFMIAQRQLQIVSSENLHPVIEATCTWCSITVPWWSATALARASGNSRAVLSTL